MRSNAIFLKFKQALLLVVEQPLLWASLSAAVERLLVTVTAPILRTVGSVGPTMNATGLGCNYLEPKPQLDHDHAV
jgi:hypothetical protein